MKPAHEIEELLRSAIGLDVESVGLNTIQRAIEKRMRSSSIPTLVEYLQKLHVDNSELQELIECVVVPETWFFRGSEAFAALLEIAREIHRKSGARQLRILSVPSSTGEEPYSIVMAMLDGGFKPGEFTLDAVDISVLALEKAGVALYRSNSFRGNDLSFRDRHFTDGGSAWQLSRSVMDQVRFRRRNVVAADFLSDCAPFHVIFCRNLLIYLGGETQSRLVDRLTDLLVPGGYLFLGPGEASAISGRPFTPAGYPMAFAHQKQVPLITAEPDRDRRKVKGKAGERRSRTKENALGSAPSPPFILPFARKDPRRPPGVPTQKNICATEEDPLSQARALANAGRTAEAAAICESLIADGQSSADVLYLLGILRDSLGELSAAAECYRKAIYLNPAHSEAMLHLALVREREGESGMAAALRARARRVNTGGGDHR